MPMPHVYLNVASASSRCGRTAGPNTPQALVSTQPYTPSSPAARHHPLGAARGAAGHPAPVQPGHPQGGAHRRRQRDPAAPANRQAVPAAARPPSAAAAALLPTAAHSAGGRVSSEGQRAQQPLGRGGGRGGGGGARISRRPGAKQWAGGEHGLSVMMHRVQNTQERCLRILASMYGGMRMPRHVLCPSMRLLQSR